ncbi:MAG: hypothetical protein DRN12_01715 [Thermoplasmata archaeon]|nr:MAG: hypothetical protein DRN12_01715 [Thermoplasmata archaeon]
MVEFETIKAIEVKFGRNNFIEVSRRKAVSKNGEVEFIAIARGFYLADGSKGWKSSITLPNDKDKLEEIAELIKSI